MENTNDGGTPLSGRATRRIARAAIVRARTAGAAPGTQNRTAAPAIPVTVAGQKHVAPAGRHSQQTHRRAAERAEAQGHATPREQHNHDRDEVIARIQTTEDGKLAQQRNEQSRRSGA